MADERCVFCRTERGERLTFGNGESACLRCTRLLGTMLRDNDRTLTGIWPALVDDDDGPEPMVRMPDGRKVELRERTAELKKELTIPQRAELAATYVQIGLLREAILEVAEVLASGEIEPSQKVLALLFTDPLSAPDAQERVRPYLLPV